MKGRVCEKGVIQFLSVGYGAIDITLRPSGFTIFMFHPERATAGRSTKVVLQSIRSMFGEKSVDEEAVKYYTTQDYYLADNLRDFEHQLETCVEFLDLLTHKSGITSEGYRYLLSCIQDEYSTFRNLFTNDRHFGVKLGYMADRVFQNFLGKFLRYKDRPSPIESARRRLKGRQLDDIDGVLKGIDFGVTPNIHLPESLNPSSRGRNHNEDDRRHRDDQRYREDDRRDDRRYREDNRRCDRGARKETPLGKIFTATFIHQDW
jgi:hypothetical protein